jgi:hypothetical protein
MLRRRVEPAAVHAPAAHISPIPVLRALPVPRAPDFLRREEGASVPQPCILREALGISGARSSWVDVLEIVPKWVWSDQGNGSLNPTDELDTA